uniref:G-protein coupled receptors family 2 profile 1 domain-containing protein n=1 Tax=Timema shepardi TaxID=629360 RepID=A0A7R9G578_TIMSH|nr:unnamed protein product [Timema shepardi]
MWDGWDCWNSTPEGSTQYNYCKEYVYSSDKPPKCNHPCLKQCFSRNKTMTEATWNITSNYQGCSTRSRLAFRYLYHVGLLSVSTFSSIPAVIIFFSYRRLRITRIALHRNLLIANVFRCSMAIFQKVFVTYEALNTQNDDKSLMDKNGTGCKILAVLVLISANSMFAMMLLEAVFLHRLIAAAFKAEPNMKILYCFAAGCREIPIPFTRALRDSNPLRKGVVRFQYPSQRCRNTPISFTRCREIPIPSQGCLVTIFPVVAWIILRATKEDTDCWSTDDNGYQWINDGTRITLLAVECIKSFECGDRKN